MATQEVQALLAAHAPHFSLTAEGKVKCELNGHTFPARADALEAFINGKKFAKLKKAADLDAGLAKYEPFIVRSRNLPGMLFCALTGELLGARLEDIRHHLKGRKWARAKERFDADEQELLEEPDMGEEGAEDMEEDDGPGIFIPEDVLREYEMGDAEEEGEGAEEEGGDGAAEEAEAAAEGKKAAAARGKGGKAAKSGKGGAVQQAAAKQQQGRQQQQKGRQRGKAAAGGDDAAPAAKQHQPNASRGKGKQPAAKQQQKQKEKGAAVAGGAGGGGKAKAPKAKRARTAA